MESPAWSAFLKADASFKAGDYPSALSLFDEALRLARKEKNWEVLALAVGWKGETHRALGQVNAVCIFSFSLFSLSHSSLASVR